MLVSQCGLDSWPLACGSSSVKTNSTVMVTLYPNVPVAPTCVLSLSADSSDAVRILINATTRHKAQRLEVKNRGKEMGGGPWLLT